MQEKIRTMKKIHVLPTDKPSRIYLNTGEWFFENDYSLSVDECINQNIYITSDEEIKDGDWYISILENEVYKATKETQNIMSVANLIGTTTYKNTHFKIILTTDQDLIKDGVQAIDYEFLEWFVKNPSCERIEVNGISDVALGGFADVCYKIIIPKEEPKQELEKEMFELEQELDIPSHLRWHNSKPKQETLKQYDAESYLAGIKSDLAQDYWCKQQERMYSIIDEYVNDVMGGCNLRFEEWFEQFKNK